MALTLVTTVGSATANSYNTTAEIDAVAAELLPAPVTWDIQSTDIKARAMVQATRLIDRLPAPGDRVDDTQALAWPRAGVSRPSELDTYSTTAIPAPVKLAHARLSLYLVEQHALGLEPFAPAEGGIQAITFGNELSMQFEAGATNASDGARFMAAVVRPILGPLCLAAQPRLVRG